MTSTGTTSEELWRYDLGKQQWVQLSSAPTGLSMHSAHYRPASRTMIIMLGMDARSSRFLDIMLYDIGMSWSCHAEHAPFPVDEGTII